MVAATDYHQGQVTVRTPKECDAALQLNRSVSGLKYTLPRRSQLSITFVSYTFCTARTNHMTALELNEVIVFLSDALFRGSEKTKTGPTLMNCITYTVYTPLFRGLSCFV